MFRLSLFRFVLWILAAALLAACGGPAGPTPTRPAPTPTPCRPSVLSAVPPASDPSDVLLSLEWEGGFGPPELAYEFGRVPAFLLRADGMAYYTDPEEAGQAQLVQASLSPAEVQGLLQTVLGLGFECLDSHTEACLDLEGGMQECVADAGLSVLRARLPSGELREIRNWADFADNRDALRAIRSLLDGYTHPDQRPYAPQAAALFLQPVAEPEGVPVVDWPLASAQPFGVTGPCQWAVGTDDLRALIAAVGRNLGDFWFRYEGQVLQAHLTPWLPGVDYTPQIMAEGPMCEVLEIITVIPELPTPVAGPAGATATARAASTPVILAPGESYLTVRAWIDGRSQLVVQGDGVHWHHLDWAVPGRLFEDETGLQHDDPTYLNGVEWMPRWPDVPDVENRDCACDSSPYLEIPPLAAEDQVVRLAVELGRGPVSIEQQPGAANAYTLIVQVDDDEWGGADWYEFTLYYR